MKCARVLTVFPHRASRALCWWVSLQVMQLLLNAAKNTPVSYLAKQVLIKCYTIFFNFNFSDNLRSESNLLGTTVIF